MRTVLGAEYRIVYDHGWRFRRNQQQRDAYSFARGGTTGHAAIPTAAGFTACQTSTNG